MSRRKFLAVLGVRCERWAIDGDAKTTERYRGVAAGVEVSATRFLWRCRSVAPDHLVWHVEFCAGAWRSGGGFRATLEESEAEARASMQSTAAALSAFLLRATP